MHVWVSESLCCYNLTRWYVITSQNTPRDCGQIVIMRPCWAVIRLRSHDESMDGWSGGLVTDQHASSASIVWYMCLIDWYKNVVSKQWNLTFVCAFSHRKLVSKCTQKFLKPAEQKKDSKGERAKPNLWFIICLCRVTWDEAIHLSLISEWAVHHYCAISVFSSCSVN